MKQVLVIREFGEFSKVLNDAAIETVELPLIAIELVHQKITNIDSYDGIFITSQYAAEFLLKNIAGYTGKIYILGGRSFEILESTRAEKVYFENANNITELFESINIDELKGKKILFIRGDKSLGFISGKLAGVANFEELIVYKNLKINPDDPMINEIRRAINARQIEVACFFSPSGSEAFIDIFATGSHQLKLAAIGNTTAEFFRENGNDVWLVSKNATAKEFANEVIEKIKNE